jgi:hypothetical protein
MSQPGFAQLVFLAIFLDERSNSGFVKGQSWSVLVIDIEFLAKEPSVPERKQ